MIDTNKDMENLMYFLFMEEEEKRYKKEQEQKQLDNIVVENRNQFGREESHT